MGILKPITLFHENRNRHSEILIAFVSFFRATCHKKHVQLPSSKLRVHIEAGEKFMKLCRYVLVKNRHLKR